MIPQLKFIFSVIFLFLSGLFVYAQSPNIIIIICDDLNDSIDGIGVIRKHILQILIGLEVLESLF